MSEFKYLPLYPMFDFGNVKFEKVSGKGGSVLKFDNKNYLKIEYDDLKTIAEKSFSEINYFFSKSHLQKLSDILKDKESSENDKFVARKLIENAVISSSKIFPLCQDTGTATISAEKGNLVLTDFDEKKALSEGVFETYKNENLRYSQLVPLSFYEEINSKTNLPAQIDIYSGKGNDFKFNFVAKGGGSSNKTFFFTENKSLLKPAEFRTFLEANIKKIGTAACPPYNIGVVIGGTSPEMNLKTLKLLTSGSLEHVKPSKSGEYYALRDFEIEKIISDICVNTKMGAQYGGKYFALSTKAISLPRHGASVFVSIGVSCYAHRNQFGLINEDGIFLEEKEKDPSKYLPDEQVDFKNPAKINLDQPMDKIREELSKLSVSSPILLNGTIIVARDIAHSKILEILEKEKTLPAYIKNHPVYYAGPAKVPLGFPSGSFGPTTSARMDSYTEPFQKNQGSLVMIGKGNRASIVKNSCQKYKGFYLGAIGGAAALVGKNCIKSIEVIDFEELGMEAVFKIKVNDFPAFLVIDDKGNDFFENL
ncbi:MAG: FumA C-terminus/TtdB family hydratase beta subunit [Desulforegulaceae bacterium]|nr:FumA C-terminus/TtdB family hydratase beta subunit [Desulforegulaceae bacterium]